MMAGKHIDDDSYVVRVRALVMVRDESMDGWTPLAGGPLSIVGVCKIQPEDVNKKNEYVIYGTLVENQAVVLECVLRKDATYTRVNPTFHHWRTDEKRFGLTFQSTADARAFDRGVKRAIEDLMDGSSDSFLNQGTDADLGDDDVFVSSFDSMTEAHGPSVGQVPQECDIRDPLLVGFNFNHPHANHHHLHRVHYVSRNNNKGTNGKADDKKHHHHQQQQQQQQQQQHLHHQHPQTLQEAVWVKHANLEFSGNEQVDAESDSYVQFQKNAPSIHEYSYPSIDSIRPDPWKEDEMKKTAVVSSQPPPLLDKRNKKTDYGFTHRARCIYCHEIFNPDNNRCGNCPDAPDEMQQCINKVSCVNCASCMLYYCMSDADGDYGDTCSCDASDERFFRRWAGLTALSFLVPCLWCYFPLRACHKCGGACGCCGGRHKAV